MKSELASSQKNTIGITYKHCLQSETKANAKEQVCVLQL